MNEEQARFVKKLKIDHGCSSATVARKFYEKFGPTKYCNEPTGYIYFDLDAEKAKMHNISKDGPFEASSNHRVIEKLFDDDCGEELYRAAARLIDDIIEEPVYADDLIKA